MKKRLTYGILLLLIFISQTNTFAQCAMCRTSVESDLNTGGSIGKGLNTGILYLMAIPYLLLMAGFYYFFRKQVNAKLKSWKERFFPSKQVQ
ncbi:MAG: hypothetical protein ACJ77K_14390 [Bacteroidia bacterium]